MNSDVIFTHARCTGWQKNHSRRLSHAKHVQPLSQNRDRPTLTTLAYCQICVSSKKRQNELTREAVCSKLLMIHGGHGLLNTSLYGVTRHTNPGMHSQEGDRSLHITDTTCCVVNIEINRPKQGVSTFVYQ